jgi:antitoxin component of MazEF toxin-antitoxin module
MAGVRRRLTKIGNSWGVIIPKEVLDLLELRAGGEVDVQLVGNTLVVSPPDVTATEIEASLAYLVSRRERSEVYRRLAE